MSIKLKKSKKAMTQMNAIIGDPKRLKDLAKDFVTHYERITAIKVEKFV
jgi:type I restriction enzyme R subunit